MAADSSGRFVWHELSTTDPKAAEGYYTKVVGWGTQPFEGEEPYTMWTNAAGPQGGVMELAEMARQHGVPPHWLTYVSVEDVDHAVKKIQTLGGKLHFGPEDIPTVGRFAVAMDPQGAAFAVFTPEGEGTPPSAAQPGAFSWHELTTSDPNAAWRFYAELFGWTKDEAMDMGGGEVYQMFAVGGVQSGGMSRRAGIPPNWLPYVIVADLDEAVQQVRGSGGKVMVEPMEVPGGDRIAVATDPQGATLGLHQRTSA